jgi:putative endopeptidase
MNKTKKNNQKKNITKKCNRYIPFEKKYINNLKYNQLKKIKIQNDKLVENFNIKFMNDKNTDPKNDFYTYVNKRWFNNKELYNVNLTKSQKYIAQVDDFRLVQDTVYNQLNDIILDYIKKHTRTSKCMKNFYESAKKLLSKELSKTYITKSIEFIDEMRKDKKNLWKLVAEINKDESIKSNGPLVWNIVTDRKNSEYFISEITPHIFVFQDYNDYYEKDSERKKNFDKYIKNLFKVAELDISDYENVFECNRELFKLFECNKFKNDPNNYNIITAHEALEKYDFDWKSFATELGYNKVPESFVVTDLNYLSCCCKLLNDNWNSEKWRPWWIWIFVRRIISFTKDSEKVFFDFYAKTIRNIDVVNTIVRFLIITCLAFNTTISNEYVKKYYDEEKINYIKYFSEDLKMVFIRIIENNDWLSAQTKKNALKKLSTLKFDLVKPTNLLPDPLLDYNKDDIYGNIIKLMLYRTNLYISLDGKKVRPIPSLDWNSIPVKMSSYQCYIVNAMYVPTKNSIYIPLGYIQKPFIDLDNRGIEYNLSNVGFTICHEMSHCLDDMGSKYDYKGNLNDWWSNSDKIKFKKIQDDVLKQYSEWTKRDGINFDPSISLGEDLADISALYICDSYLLDFMRDKHALIPVISNSLNTFHIYFAAQQKQKITQEAQKSQLMTNPHPPNKYRCNIPMSRSRAFISNYDIKKGDKMWWSNVKPIW